jgi:hypothetical protein
MGNQLNYDQLPDETPEAWLARLQVVSPEGMTLDQRFCHQHRKERAERLVKGAQKPSAPIRKGETLPRMPQPNSIETGCDGKGHAGRRVILAVILIVALAVAGGILLTAAIISSSVVRGPWSGAKDNGPRTTDHGPRTNSEGLISSLVRGRKAARPGVTVRLLFGGSQDALEADHEEVDDRVGVDVLGPPAHVLLLEARDPLADGGLDLPLRFHGDLERAPAPGQRRHGRGPA